MLQGAIMLQASKIAKIATGSKHIARSMIHVLTELGNTRIAPVKNAEDGAHRLAGTLGLIARSHGIRVRVSGEIPRMPALLVCNYVSYFDLLAVLPLCPAIPFLPLEVSRWPVVGLAARRLGVGFVDGNDAMARVRALRRMSALVEQGVSVLHFCHGVTTMKNNIANQRIGAFALAERIDRPVIPIAIRYDDPKMAWPDGSGFLQHYGKMSRKKNIGISLMIGEPMYANSGEPRDHFAARCRHSIAGLLYRTSPSRQRSKDHSNSGPSVVDDSIPHQERIQHHAVSRAGRSSPQSRSMFSMAAVP
jgi:1-acyl-sn-glycerol-3-phosphate acyltransferase